MRPRVGLEIKGLKEELKKHLIEKIKEEGALTEKELFEEALAFFSPKLKKAAEKLIRVYRKIYGRKIGKRTAEINIIENLRRILSEIKKEIPHTERRIILGRKRYGRIFYARGREGEIARKVREIVKGSGSRAEEVLKGVRRGPFPINPSHKKAAEMLAYYGLVEMRKIGEKVYAVEPGWEGEVEIEKKRAKELFPGHFRVWKPFVASVLILRDGPEKVKLRFDIAAWDPLNRIFYLGIKKDYVSLNDVKLLRERSLMLNIPAKLVVFCKSISESARKYAKRWGIETKII